MLRRFIDTGSYEAKKRSGGAPGKISPDDEIKIEQIIEKNPDATLEEIKEEAELQVSIATIYRAIKRMNITFKKTLYPQEQNALRVQGLRNLWKIFRLGRTINNLVFIDESSIKTDMTRRYARNIKGRRVNDYVPDTRWKAMSIISSIRLNGQTESLVYKNSLTGDFLSNT